MKYFYQFENYDSLCDNYKYEDDNKYVVMENYK